MIWVFDTDVLSVLLRSRVHTTLHQRLARTPVESQALTSITLGEIAYGAAKSSQPRLFARALGVFASMEILPFDDLSARVYGPLRATLETRGRTVAEADLRIASIVLSRNAVLVTGNVKPFARIDGLKVESWLDRNV